MEEDLFQQEPESRTQVIASSGPFQIEFIEYVGSDDYNTFIKISESLVDEYGAVAKLTPKRFKRTSIKMVAYHSLPDIREISLAI